jgi:Fe-S-cluster containining protein
MQQRNVNLDRRTPFSFSCRRCLACCRNKKIQVNPYEITRLARNRGLSTSEFIKRYTTESGMHLTWDAEGRCIFLDAQGCMVHADRPLVCRLYPLGRHVTHTLQESFSEFEPDPECQGVYGTGGLVGDYLESQNAYPFMEAADKYLQLFWKLCDILQKDTIDAAGDHTGTAVLAGSSFSVAEPYDILKDVDRVVADFCKKEKVALPEDIEDVLSVHIRAIEVWADPSRKGGKNEEKVNG